MIRRPYVWLTACALALPAAAMPATAQNPPSTEYAEEPPRYSAQQLDNLVGPVALYPDALLAQVLVASTFPDQIEEAARYVRANGTAGIDDQNWDVSVKAVAHYPSALNTMADKSDWTATLGVAYANQSSDVMTAVQRLRSMADAQGNLVTTSQQQVVREGNTYIIAPAQPRVVYVPVYDPVVVYTRPIFSVGFSSRYWSFGVGFPIGGWLTYDCDWGYNRVYYNGWNTAYIAYGGGWRVRSRPFIQVTNVYVSPRYRNVYVNRNVYRRTINYRNVDRYAGVHRDVYFDGRRDGYRDGYRDANRDDRRDGYRDGNRNGNGNRDGNGNDGYTGRTAQPRGDRDAATPDGYRQGDRGNRSAAAPSDRRSEQSSTVRTMSVGEARDNTGERTDWNAPRRETGRNESAPRGSQPRVAMPKTDPYIGPPPSAPAVVGDARERERNDRARQMQTISAMAGRSREKASEPRQTQPKASEPRQAQPRQAQPRSNGGGGGGSSKAASSSGSRSAKGRRGS